MSQQLDDITAVMSHFFFFFSHQKKKTKRKTKNGIVGRPPSNSSVPGWAKSIVLGWDKDRTLLFFLFFFFGCERWGEKVK